MYNLTTPQSHCLTILAERLHTKALETFQTLPDEGLWPVRVCIEDARCWFYEPFGFGVRFSGFTNDDTHSYCRLMEAAVYVGNSAVRIIMAIGYEKVKTLLESPDFETSLIRIFTKELDYWKDELSDSGWYRENRVEDRFEQGKFRVFCQNSILANTLYVKMILGAKGIEVMTNTDMEKAHERILDYQPRLVLSDIHDKPGGMTGYDLCHQHKTNIYTCPIPFCFLSSLNHLEDVKRGFEAGAECYMNLPMDKYLLERTIMRILTYFQ